MENFQSQQTMWGSVFLEDEGKVFSLSTLLRTVKQVSDIKYFILLIKTYSKEISRVKHGKAAYKKISCSN